MSDKVISDQHQMYQEYSQAEDTERSAHHYEQHPQFYYYFTGGEWNVYSCSFWPTEQSTITEAQQSKLDMLAKEMQLKPGMRILDVGCGWGGPLTYLCKTYGVTGVGITVSPKQRDEAIARALRYGVDAKFFVCHWENFTDEQGFDAVYSDEVIVHFFNLSGFFAHCWKLLKMDGRMVHKELHFTHKRHTKFGRTGEHAHAVFAFSGSYRLLAEELQMLNDTGFEIVQVTQIPITQYMRTMDFWLHNLFENREAIKSLVGEQVYSDFRKYIKIYRWAFTTNSLTLDVLTSKKVDPEVTPQGQ
jgi:cyclopropane-fatty-acyl-phospholipid synthase